MKFTLLGFGLAMASLSSAQVYIDTFGSGGIYDGQAGATIAGIDSPAGNELVQGFQFQAMESGPVRQMVLAMGHFQGTPEVTMRLFTDNGSNELGTQVGSPFTTAVNANSLGMGTEVITRNVTSAGWTVTSGQKYWLHAQAANDGLLAWNFAGDEILYWNVFILNGGTPLYSDENLAMAVRLEAVPEPASMIALGAGLLAVARRRRRG